MNRKYPRRAGAINSFLLVIVAFLVGIAVAAIWFVRKPQPQPPQETAVTAAESPRLSEATKSVLRALNGPVSVHYYAVLDASGDTAALQAFAGRIAQLLNVYAQEANGRLVLTQSVGEAYATANNAVAAGLAPFNQANGSACFLGIVVEQGGRRETLAKLEPEWEGSVESDLTRAIDRLNGAPSPASVGPAPANEAALVEEVKTLVPNLDSVTKADAVRVLRAASLAEYKRTLAEMTAQVQEAEAQLKQAQAGGSEADQKAAQEKLQAVQAQQADRLKDIGIRCQEQIEVLDRLKR
jgi:hypothetical protein